MMRFTFNRGLALLDGQTRWTLDRSLATRAFQFISDNGELRNLTLSQVHLEWLSGRWIVDEACLGSLANATYVTIPRDLATFSEHQQRQARRTLGYLQAIAPESNRYNVMRWKGLIDRHAAEIGDPTPPCASGLHRWWRKYRITKSINALVPRVARHDRGRPKETFALFEQAVSEVYLTLEKQPKIAVYERVQRLVKRMNASSPDSPQLRCPSRATVYRWLHDLRQDVVDTAREGKEAARTKYRSVNEGLKVNGVLERLEIDHTPVDLIVIDPITNLPLGRPTLTVGFDPGADMPMGFYLSFKAPGAHSVLQCLRQCILPKTELLAQVPGVVGTWPAHGIPDLIAIDNGLEFHGTALEKACQEMGIQTLFCGSRTPQHKGAVERFFRTINEALFHRLPGTTFSNTSARGDYDSASAAVISMEDLVHLITKWIVDIHLVGSPSRGGASPLEKWSERAARRPIELPVYPAQLDVIRGTPATRVLFHYGIELDGLHYNSDELQELRRIHGGNPPVDLKFYEDSVAHIFVFDPQLEEYIQVPCVLIDYAKNLSRAGHLMVRQKMREKYPHGASTPQMLEARAEIESVIEKAVKAKKMRARKDARGAQMYDSERVFSGQSSATVRSRDLRGAPPPKPLPSGLDDELPDLPLLIEGEK